MDSDENPILGPSAPWASIRQAILEVYEAVGRDGSRGPQGLCVATGAALARDLGYDPRDLEALPPKVLQAFVGAAPLYQEVTGAAGEWVADLGCGAGVDSFLLAARGYRVVATDLSPAMLRRLSSRTTPGPMPVRSELPRLPLRSGTIVCALLNGVANLVRDRAELLREVHRVLRPGGRLLVADLLATEEVPSDLRALPDAWAWCVGGAMTPQAWLHGLRAAGFCEAAATVIETMPPLARGIVRARKGA